MQICCVCGARPNFMKIAAVMRAFEPHAALQPFLVHTGQHYDEKMCSILFDDLGLPKPDVNLEVGSASHAVQTAEILKRFEPVLLERKPDLVVVVGDVNSTVACALDAVKLGVPVAHVEAGLRSFDRSMPEEINRIMTDAVCDLLFISEPSGVENLKREGVGEEHLFFVGNVMIDTLLSLRDRAMESDVLERLGLEEKNYAALTLHRPACVDDPRKFEALLEVIDELQSELAVVFPAHPRTRKRLSEFGLDIKVESMKNLHLTEPLGYLDFMKLMSRAKFVMTDSGGIQEETTILNVPCLTLRENTERPATVEAGLNRIVGLDPERIRKEVKRVMNGIQPTSTPPRHWDGKAGQRIAEILLKCEANGIPRRK